jgi:hypothetical protein
MSLKSLFAAVLVVGLAAPVFAADEEALTPAAVEQIQLAGTLARYGEARKDPILLIAAAKIARGVSAEGPAASAKLPTMDQMLDAAKNYSGNDQTILGMIEDVKAEKTKGYCYGSHGLGWC